MNIFDLKIHHSAPQETKAISDQKIPHSALQETKAIFKTNDHNDKLIKLISLKTALLKTSQKIIP